MSAAKLRDTLAALQEQLRRAPALDDDARLALRSITADITRLLDNPPGRTAVDPTQAHRLESFAVRFEAGHPGLAASLREIVDLLGKAGV
ncbi:MAG TPA: DUF4404 family protein [Steroidobacteraceae bacterium]